MSDDPILDVLKASNPEGFRAAIESLSVALPEAIAGYSGLPEADIRALAARPSSDVRSVIARREDCPADLLAELAHDADGQVRRAVASNPATPIETVAVLAADPDEWVRWDVTRRTDLHLQPALWDLLASDATRNVRSGIASNPGCPREVLMQLAADEDFLVKYDLWKNPALPDDVKAVLVLADVSPPDELRLLSELRSSGRVPTEEDEVRSLLYSAQLTLDELRTVRAAIDNGPNMYAVRSSLADQREADERLLADLVSHASHRWEWRSLWNRYFAHAWPSTQAFSSVDVDLDVLSLFASAGHPAGLVFSQTPAVEPTVDPAVGVAQLINNEILIRALWRELALSGTCTIQAWNDNVDGDKFYLELPNFGLSEGAVAYILGGYSEYRDWVQLEDYLDEYDAVRALAHYGEDLEFEELAALDEAMCAAIAFAEENTNDLTLTRKGSQFIHQVASNMQYLDREDMSTRVVIQDSDVPEICYGELPEANKRMLVDYLMAARIHVLMEKFRLVDHFLSCIEVHPQTPADLVERIKASGFTQ